MGESESAEYFIEHQAGCGLFQILDTVLVFLLLRACSALTFIYMSYGNYNPGWKCLDNITDVDVLYSRPNVTNPWNTTSTQDDNHHSKSHHTADFNNYRTDRSCDEFKACQNVQFNPEESTLISEWGLLCHKEYIASTLTSVQILGNLFASLVAGYVADRFGRKKSVYGSLILNILLTAVSAFSTSWLMFGVLRFLIGWSSAFFESLSYVYPSEFLAQKWRARLAGVPGWAIGGLYFGVVTYLFKDWRHVLFSLCVMFGVTFLPVVFMPESLRWLEAKNKTKELNKAREKILKLNKIKIEKVTVLDENRAKLVRDSMQTDVKKYTFLDIFRFGYLGISIKTGIVWFCLGVNYYAISLGIKALNGDFYLNTMSVYAMGIPFALFETTIPSVLGRRRAGCLFSAATTFACLGAMVVQLCTEGVAKRAVILVLVIIAWAGVDAAWITQHIHVTELYPTVVRGMGMNWATLMSRLGGVASPFLIPDDEGLLFVWYLVMGLLAGLCTLFVYSLPETKGKTLKQTIEEPQTGDSVLSGKTIEASMESAL